MDTLTEMSRRAAWDIVSKDLMPYATAVLTPDNKIRIQIDETEIKNNLPAAMVLFNMDREQGLPHYRVARKAAAKAIFNAIKRQAQPGSDLLDIVAEEKLNTPMYGGWPADFLDKAKKEAAYAKTTYYGVYEPSLSSRITIAKDALAKAIIDVFFADQLAQYKTNMKNGAFRAMNITDEDKNLAKSWFADHVTNIKFRFPKNDDDSYCGLLTIPEGELERRDNSSNEVVKRWDDSFNNFIDEFPNAVEGKDYEFRLTSAESDPYKYIWNPGCSITIDEPFANAPVAAKDMLARAKSSAKNAKGYEDTVSDNMISSYWLGIAIMRLFNGDFNFYEKRRRNKRQATTDFSDALINDYEN